MWWTVAALQLISPLFLPPPDQVLAWDSHPLDEQRYYNIACLLYGSDMARLDWLPPLLGIAALGPSTLRALAATGGIATGSGRGRRCAVVFFKSTATASITRAIALAVKKLHALRLDFCGVPVLALLILPLAGLQAAFHIDQAALGQKVGAVFGLTLKNRNPVPFGAVHLVAIAVTLLPHHLAFWVGQIRLCGEA